MAFFSELDAQAQALFGNASFAQLTQAQQQQLVDRLLLLLNLAVRGRLRDEHPQLGFRVDVVVGTRGL